MARAHAGLVVAGVVLLLGVASGCAASGAPMIDPKVRHATTSGPASVLVELRIPGDIKPEGDLRDQGAVVAQSRAIEAAQQSVLDRLAGTRFSLSRRYTTVPMLALQVHPDALTALEGMGDVVARIVEDASAPPARP
jgi:hypothetical protein